MSLSYLGLGGFNIIIALIFTSFADQPEFEQGLHKLHR